MTCPHILQLYLQIYRHLLNKQYFLTHNRVSTYTKSSRFKLRGHLTDGTSSPIQRGHNRDATGARFLCDTGAHPRAANVPGSFNSSGGQALPSDGRNFQFPLQIWSTNINILYWLAKFEEETENSTYYTWILFFHDQTSQSWITYTHACHIYINDIFSRWNNRLDRQNVTPPLGNYYGDRRRQHGPSVLVHIALDAFDIM